MANTPVESGFDRLTLDEQLSLVDDLWERITGRPDAYRLTETQQADLQRRLDAYRNDPQAGSPWEEVKKKLVECNG